MSVRLYVAGPMTGLPDHNVAAFNRAELVLKAIGYRVLNPARHEGKCTSWQGYMRLGLTDVCNADGVALLPGWENSRGAKLEKTMAEALEIPVKTLDEWLWETPDLPQDSPVVVVRT